MGLFSSDRMNEWNARLPQFYICLLLIRDGCLLFVLVSHTPSPHDLTNGLRTIELCSLFYIFWGSFTGMIRSVKITPMTKRKLRKQIRFLIRFSMRATVMKGSAWVERNSTPWKTFSTLQKFKYTLRRFHFDVIISQIFSFRLDQRVLPNIMISWWYHSGGW